MSALGSRLRAHARDAWHTLAPATDDPHGVLPPLLVTLTVVTGLVDAFSFLELGRVFVANVTGNVVFLSFALGGAPGFVWWASLLALGVFLVGAGVGGRIANRNRRAPRRQLFVAVRLQAALVAAAFAGAAWLPAPYLGWPLAALVTVLGIAMGLQNATARALAVPDLTTTVLTLTLTGIASDSTLAGGSGSRFGRRIVSVVSMFAGGLVGAFLVVENLAPLVLLLAVALLVAVAARLSASRALPGDDAA